MSWDFLSRRPLRLHPIHHPLDVKEPVRLLYASDLHFAPWTAHVASQILTAVEAFSPHIVALGGDLLDAPWALDLLKSLAQDLVARTSVVAVLGNHDRFLGPRRIARALTDAGVVMLDKPWKHSSGLLVQGDNRESVFIAHHPTQFRRSCGLTLAGHLHGCQWVAWERNGLQYPGAWFFRYHGREFREGDARMVVSLGVNDTLPLRYNCPREVLAVTLSKSL